MRVLLDTHALLEILAKSLSREPSSYDHLLEDENVFVIVSVCSLWEIAIKTRLGKLDPGMPIDEIAEYVDSLGVDILSIDRHHAVTNASPDPSTRDPFDRMLLAQCKVERLKLVTADRALAAHPLAWRGGA